MNLLRVASTISLFTLASRVTGLFRDVLMASLFGASAWMDAFNVAFRIPNLLRRLFAEGAFSQAFVPVLARTRAAEGDEETRRLIDAVATVLFWTLVVTCVLGIAAAPIIVWLMASGLERFDGAVLMTRLMFPYIGFMSLVALSAGVLNTWKRFARAGRHAGPAEPFDDRRGMAFRALAAPARHRADLRIDRRRDRRRRIAARGPTAGAGAHRRLSAARARPRADPIRLASPGRAPHHEPDGTGAGGGLRRAVLDDDQHPDRLAPGRRRGLVADLCRPPDGVSDRAARRRPRHGPDAAAGRCARPATRPAIRAARLGPAPGADARAAVRDRAAGVPDALVAVLFQRGAFTRSTCRRPSPR